MHARFWKGKQVRPWCYTLLLGLVVGSRGGMYPSTKKTRTVRMGQTGLEGPSRRKHLTQKGLGGPGWGMEAGLV